MKNRISLTIICKNSSNYLKINQNLFKNFNEIIVVDDYSTDDTKKYCEKNGIRYFQRRLNNDYSSQRNFVLEKIVSEWVLFLDTDEVINDQFVEEINMKVKENKYSGFYIQRQVKFLSHTMKGTEMGNDKVLRLARKNAGKWTRKVHEYWDVKGDVGTIESPVFHNTAVDLHSFIKKLSVYSSIHSKENENAGKKSSIFKVIFYPKLKFINNFFIKNGFRDREYGFVSSVLMSFHSFLSWSDSWLEKSKI